MTKVTSAAIFAAVSLMWTICQSGCFNWTPDSDCWPAQGQPNNGGVVLPQLPTDPSPGGDHPQEQPGGGGVGACNAGTSPKPPTPNGGVPKGGGQATEPYVGRCVVQLSDQACAESGARETGCTYLYQSSHQYGPNTQPGTVQLDCEADNHVVFSGPPEAGNPYPQAPSAICTQCGVDLSKWDLYEGYCYEPVGADGKQPKKEIAPRRFDKIETCRAHVLESYPSCIAPAYCTKLSATSGNEDFLCSGWCYSQRFSKFNLAVDVFVGDNSPETAPWAACNIAFPKSDTVPWEDKYHSPKMSCEKSGSSQGPTPPPPPPEHEWICSGKMDCSTIKAPIQKKTFDMIPPSHVWSESGEKAKAWLMVQMEEALNEADPKVKWSCFPSDRVICSRADMN